MSNPQSWKAVRDDQFNEMIAGIAALSPTKERTMKLPSSWDSMSESRFLKQSDFEQPTLCTIAAFERQNVAQENEAPEVKWVLNFAGYPKGLMLNAVNRQTLAEMFSSPEDSIGQPVVVYVDDTIMFGGKRVGGVRLRPPKGAKPEPKDDIPF